MEGGVGDGARHQCNVRVEVVVEHWRGQKSGRIGQHLVTTLLKGRETEMDQVTHSNVEATMVDYKRLLWGWP